MIVNKNLEAVRQELAIEEKQYPCFTIVPNSHYEIVVEEKPYYYCGSLEDLDTLNQLEEIV